RAAQNSAVAEMATISSSLARFSVISQPSSNSQYILFNVAPRTGTPNFRTGSARFRCSAGQTGFFTKLGRLIKEKAKSDVEKALLPAVSVVDELGIPVKFVGVGEGVEDLQPFDADAFVNAIFM
ncbi:hypothetical protein V8G54_010281, partial [Vigna mungo]